ncbi:MAG TPA: class III signal peptide-containing protein, partial [Candidatus Diapherotrites archaeon]|nr:class III signal peptide-containing protein [Candidatus Diapherotrites archaeon]
MIKSKKKAQVSVEALILVGIIVLGATIFASMYLSRITHGINSSTKLDAGLSDIYNDPFNNGTSTDINTELPVTGG